MTRYLTVLALAVSICAPANAQDVHPAMEAKFWATGGTFIAKRTLQASASATFEAEPAPTPTRVFDFERALGLDDSPDLFMAELGWQFSDNWGIAMQHFRSKRDNSKVLEETVEWQGNVYDVGVQINAGVRMDINRFFLARRFRDNGPHSLKVGGGIHWLDMSAYVSGEATIDNQTTEFRTSSAKASLPVPNIGLWYRYSPNENWLITARTDWLSADVDKYSGDIWNASLGVNFRIWDHVGAGVNFQYFELTGKIREDNWRGSITTSFTGPYLFISGYW